MDELKEPKSPKLNRKNLPKRARHMSKAQLLHAMQRKTNCNAKAQSIVLQCIEIVEDENSFTEALKHINQTHYQDIVEERALAKLCGYPMCKNDLIEYPKQRYHISTVTNKIYDLAERRNFCSSKCFKSSNYIKEQMLTSPLWLRDQEDIPEFKLLSIC